MTKNQFIERQIYYSLQKGKEPRSVIESVLSSSCTQSETDKALQEYDASGSVSQVLQSLGVINLDKNFLPILKEIETNETTSESITLILETKLIIKKTISLMQARLNIGLSYALVLVTIASLVLYLTSGDIVETFGVFFDETGTRLPKFSQFVISWQDSYFGPQFIAPILFILITFLLVITKRSSEKENSLAIFNKIPFLNNIVDFAKNLNWITQLKLLANANYSLEDAKAKLSIDSKLLSKHSPRIMTDLNNAEKLGNLNQEIEFQFDNLATNAELVVTKACRNLVAIIMVFVVSFVAMTVIASYLPIFQIGAIV